MEYYDKFEQHLQLELLRLCHSLGELDQILPESADITGKWNDLATPYMADAVEQIKDYPEAAIAWAAYMGMAVARWWDEDWAVHQGQPYDSLYGPHGFDDMDDYIMEHILQHPLGSPEAEKITSTIYSCTQKAISIIRKEQIEFGTEKAFYVLCRTVAVLYRIGAGLQLKRMGYKFEKIRYN